MPGVAALLDIVFISLASGVARLVRASQLTEGGPLLLDIDYFFLFFELHVLSNDWSWRHLKPRSHVGLAVAAIQVSRYAYKGSLKMAF